MTTGLIRKSKDRVRKEYYIGNLHSEPLLLKSAEELEKAGTFSESGAIEYVFSPLLLVFSLWVLQQARKDRVKKLFFLARDGYPVYIAARRLCDFFQLDIECRYFYCSRYSLRIPMYSEDMNETLDHVCRGGIDVTFRKIMIRSGFSTGEISRMKAVFPDIDFDRIIPYPELKRVRERLSSCQVYLDEVKAVSRSGWKNLRAYFEQEGMLAEGIIGLVDSGWTGTTQKSIHDILLRCGCNSNLRGYYFGLFEKPDQNIYGKYNSFYFGPKRGIINKVMFSNCLLETVLSANHGTTRGYIHREKIIPDLEEIQENLKMQNLHEEMEIYTSFFVKNAAGLDFDALQIDQYKHRICKSLRTFMWNPTSLEAEIFGTLQFSDDLLDQTTRELAPALSAEQLKENHFWNKVLTAYGIRTKPIHESAWFEGSAVRNGSHTVIHRLSNSLYKMFSYLKKGL